MALRVQATVIEESREALTIQLETAAGRIDPASTPMLPLLKALRGSHTAVHGVTDIKAHNGLLRLAHSGKVDSSVYAWIRDTASGLGCYRFKLITPRA